MARITARARWVFGAAVVFALGGHPVSADVPSLKWKFTPGETLHYRMEQKTVTELKSNGQNIKTTVNQITDTTWVVKSVDDAGKAQMTQTIDRLQTKIESPFALFEYDSKADKAPEGAIAAGVVPTLKALAGSTFEYAMSPQGEPTDVKVPDGLIKALKEAGPTAGGVGMFSEDGLKNMIHESSLILPTKDLDKPWVRQTKIPSPPIGTMVVDKTYKLDGPAEGAEKISLRMKVSLDPEAKSEIQIKIGEQSGEGSFFFDNKAGRVVKSTVSQKIKMLFTVPGGGEVPQSTDTSTTMTLVDVKEGAAK